MEQIKVNVPEGCTANIKKEDGFLIVTFEQKAKEDEENAEKWKPKNGDIIAFGKCINDPLIAIYKETFVDDTFHIHCLVGKKDDKITLYSKGWLNYNMRPATDSEKQHLFDALTKAGKRWNAKEKRIEDLPRWRAEKGILYYFIDRYFEVAHYFDLGTIDEDKKYHLGNYFKTEEAAERVASQIREIFKKSKAE